MRPIRPLLLVLLTLAIAGCNDGSVTGPRDKTPPAAPRGLYSVTGDHSVTLHWLSNTEGDVSGYRVYQSNCDAPGCLYDPSGSTQGTAFAVTSLQNGVTRYFAVSAVDAAGNESDLSYDTVFDTPRPQGIGAVVANASADPAHAGWDFSVAFARAASDTATDVYYADDGTVHAMFARDLRTDIQDMGYTNSLDALDFAPPLGWSPSGTVELIPLHTYVVWTRDNHFAKFRVTSLTATDVTMDWAYQTAAGNGELRVRRSGGAGALAAVPFAKR